MNIKLGTSDARNLLHEIGTMFRHLRPQIEKLDVRAGLCVDLESVEPESTDDQRKGLHVLLNYWIAHDPRIKCDTETLRHWCCMKLFGEVVAIMPDGQEMRLPARTTTRRWCHNRDTYVPSRLSRKRYSDLLEYVPMLAGDRGIVLPELKRERAT